MYSSSQSATRTILIRLTVFILSVSVAEGLVILMSRARHDSIPPVVRGTKNKEAFSPVTVASVPWIPFPKSIPTNRYVEFVIPLSMVVGSDGNVRNIQITEESVAEVAEQVFYDNIRFKTRGRQSDEISSELVDLLTTQMKETKFKPRTFNGEGLPTMVFVTSHFKAYRDLCPQIMTELKAAGDVIWSGDTSFRCAQTMP